MSERETTVYKAADGWRWHTRASSDLVAESGEAYSSKDKALEAAEKFAPESKVVVVETK